MDCGPVLIPQLPWQRDLDRMEEDWFLPMAAPADGVCAISLAGARILARRLRDSVALQQQWALLRAVTDQRCPFDLHRLLPVPPAILRLGPEDPQSQAWLWRHWGTTRALRHIRLLPSPADRRNRRTGHWLVRGINDGKLVKGVKLFVVCDKPGSLLDLEPANTDDRAGTLPMLPQLAAPGFQSDLLGDSSFRARPLQRQRSSMTFMSGFIRRHPRRALPAKQDQVGHGAVVRLAQPLPPA